MSIILDYQIKELKTMAIGCKSEESAYLKEILNQAAETIELLYENLKKYDDLEKKGKLLELPCAVGDTVFDVVFCDDERYHIFSMRVCDINFYGNLRNGKIWNLYLENEYTKSYRSFYDFGKSIFLTIEEAKIKLKELEEITNKEVLK